MFWFELVLEARAEILKKFSWFYGRFEDTKRHFENNRSLGNISFKVTDDILASQNAKVAIENNSNGKNVVNLQVMNDISKEPFIYYVCMLFLNNQPTLVIIFSVIEIAIFWITYIPIYPFMLTLRCWITVESK